MIIITAGLMQNFLRQMIYNRTFARIDLEQQHHYEHFRAI